MKKSALFGIILCCFSCETLHSQYKIAVVDIDTLAQNLLSDIRFDSVYRAANTLLRDTLAHRKGC